MENIDSINNTNESRNHHYRLSKNGFFKAVGSLLDGFGVTQLGYRPAKSDQEAFAQDAEALRQDGEDALGKKPIEFTDYEPVRRVKL